MTKGKIEVGRLLKASVTEFTAACNVSQSNIPEFGDIVVAEINSSYQVYGIITNIAIDEGNDGMVRTLATAGGQVPNAINNTIKNFPILMNVIVIGSKKKGKISQLLPPTPPLVLNAITLPQEAELVLFTQSRSYLRHILRHRTSHIPVGEIMAAHVSKMAEIHKNNKNLEWVQNAVQEITTMLRDDYDALMNFSISIGEVPADMLQKPKTNKNQAVGFVMNGNISSLDVRMTAENGDLREGAFLTIEDKDKKFFGLLSDFQLGSSNSKFAEGMGVQQLPQHVADAIKGQTLFTNIKVLPGLMMDTGYSKPGPMKCLPGHHALVHPATADDIKLIFGDKDDPQNFVIGNTREQNIPVCIDLDKFVQRSSGIFGASGTGKSFTVRMILAGLINRDTASVLVLDMHNEYGLDDIASDTGQAVVGLRTKFPTKVRIVGIGKGTKIRGQAPDFNLEIGMEDIATSDIELLSDELGLKETTPTTLDALYGDYRNNWFKAFAKMKVGATVPVDPNNPDGKHIPAPDSVHAWANRAGVNVMAAEGLHSKLHRLFNKTYIVEKPAVKDGIGEIIKMLESGQHVVLSFGKFESDLDYLLISNILTRRIRSAWEIKTNNFRNQGRLRAAPPRPLTIVVEEAHKLLSPSLAKQTTFGTIARELRKYYVTLTIIDQRPSQISSEVMSQVGTRISGWLGSSDDIASVFEGLSGKESLRDMLSRLQPKAEALVMGWGVPMTIPVRTRRYDQKFWEELLGKNQGNQKEKSNGSKFSQEVGANNIASVEETLNDLGF
jgi:hypothetical protein